MTNKTFSDTELVDGEIITLEKAGDFKKYGFRDGDRVKIIKIDETHFRMIKISELKK